MHFSRLSYPIFTMPLPFFFEEEIPDEKIFNLSHPTSKHIVQVLRMYKGDQLNLTTGKGKVITAEIVLENKKGLQSLICKPFLLLYLWRSIKQESFKHAIITGISVVLIYFSQRLWLLWVLPLGFYFTYKYTWKQWGMLVLSGVTRKCS